MDEQTDPIVLFALVHAYFTVFEEDLGPWYYIADAQFLLSPALADRLARLLRDDPERSARLRAAHEEFSTLHDLLAPVQ